MINSLDNYFNTDEFKNYLRVYEKSQQEGTSCILSSDDLADISEYYFVIGKTTKAKEAAEYAASLYPEASAPYFSLARFSLVADKDKEAARKYIEKITDKTSSGYYLIIAEYYLFDKKPEKARKAIEHGMAELQDEEQADLCVDAAALHIDYGYIEEAKQYLALDKYEDYDSDYVQKLKARIDFIEGNYDKGLQLYEGLIDKDPFNPENWKRLAAEQNASDKYSASATSCEYAIAINDKDDEAYMLLGNAYFKMCSYDKALEAYSKFLELSDNELAYIMISRCYFCKQNMEKALEYLKMAEEKCVDNTSNKIDMYRDFAIIYGWKGNFEEAFKYLDKLKEIGKYDADTCLIEGGILLDMNKFEKANEVFSKGFEQASDTQEYMYMVAVSFYEHRNDMAAYMLLKKVFEENPERTRGLAYITACSYYLGMNEEFIKYLKMAVERNSEEAKAILADIFPANMQPYDYVEYAMRKNKEDGHDGKTET